MSDTNNTSLRSENRSTDMIVGISDGLLIPFAVCAGISRIAKEHTTVFIVGIIAAAIGAVAMGLARYYAGRSEMVHMNEPDLHDLHVDDEAHKSIAEGIKEDNEKWNNYLREHGMVIDKDIQSASLSGRNIGLFYFLGGLIPLFPYLVFTDNYQGFIASSVVAILSLFTFGFLKGKYTESGSLFTGVRLSIMGGILAFAAYCVAGFFA